MSIVIATNERKQYNVILFTLKIINSSHTDTFKLCDWHLVLQLQQLSLVHGQHSDLVMFILALFE